MPRTKKDPAVEAATEVVESSKGELTAIELAQAIVSAIRASQPPTKKTVLTIDRKNSWLPNDGSPRLKLRRKHYHHGIPIDERLTNEEIALLNKLRVGTYLDGYVRVIKRRDKGIDIDYPISTKSQVSRLANQFGINSFAELLRRCIDEAARPKQVDGLGDEE